MFRTKCKEHDHSSFYKFLQMEHNHKNLDCYFFYYSTCKKGEFCPYRHEPSALGCETTCTYWQQGNCLNEHCNFRHMELKKNRKSIPCYWETQPGGCRKPHCPFLHASPRNISNDPINPVKTTEVATKSPNQEWLNRQDDPKYDGSSTTESDQGRGNSEAGSFIGSPAVDPLIVKFEEESDNESVPSPVKSQPKVPLCKTYEQMRLEEIQAESAAYYSYEAGNDAKLFRKTRRISNRWVNSLKVEQPVKKLDFQVLSLEEIRRRKKEKELVAKALLMDTSDEIQTKPPSPIETTRTVKKRSIDCVEESSISPAKKRRTSPEFIKNSESIIKSSELIIKSSEPIIKSPPIKLRRTLKTVFQKSFLKETETEPCKDTTGLMKDGDKVSCHERLESHSNESINTTRRSEVEVRLCDSSTNEEKTQTQPEQATDDRKSVATYTMEDIMSVNALLTGQSYTNTEDEYLRLDYTSSDDIMRDIEDLLK